jgi:predicted nuclease of predicted toxin-antitoxin system
MKFKLDENLSVIARDPLEADGHDVITVAEQNLSGAPDDQLHEVCRGDDRVLVTFGHDYGRATRFQPEMTAGIVVLECWCQF